MEQFWSPNEVAQRLHVEPRTVRAWIHRGQLRAVNTGRLWRISEQDLQAFLREGKSSIPDPLAHVNEVLEDTDRQ